MNIQTRDHSCSLQSTLPISRQQNGTISSPRPSLEFVCLVILGQTHVAHWLIVIASFYSETNNFHDNFIVMYMMYTVLTQSKTAKFIRMMKVLVPKCIRLGVYVKSWWLKDSTQNVSRHYNSDKKIITKIQTKTLKW